MTMTPLRGIEAVHLGQQLVEGLLALFVRAERRRHAHFAERIQFIDENDARRAGFGLCEQVSHARRADADEHLDELRSAQAEERHVGFARHGTGKERLSRPGRTEQQHALRDAATEVRVLVRMLQELDDLAELLRRFVDAGDIGKRHLDIVLGVDLGATAFEGHRAPWGHPSQHKFHTRTIRPSGSSQPMRLLHQFVSVSPVNFTPCCSSSSRRRGSSIRVVSNA